MPRKKSIPGTAHHPFGPSRWPMLLDCAHFEGKASSADAERGTALHELFALVLKGEEVEDSSDLFESNVVKLAVKYRSMHLEDKGDLAQGEKAMLVEELVWLDIPMGPVGDIYGRVDCAFMDRNRILHVIDLKMAENPERDYRPQLIAYARGIVASTDFDPVAVCFHLAYADSGREVVVQKPADEVWCRYEELHERIQAIASGERTSPRQCGWCSLRSKHESCPAARAVAETVSATLADAPERWAEFSPSRKAQMCVLADAVIKWGEAIRERASEDAKAGLPVEDVEHGVYYGTKPRKGRLVIPDVKHAWELVKPFLTAEQYRGCLSVNQAELKTALKLTGMSPADVDATIERCGDRLPPSLVFVRKSA